MGVFRIRFVAGVLVVAATIAAFMLRGVAATNSGNLTFSNTALLTTDGNSEPAVSIGPSGTLAVSGLSWLEFGTNLWTGKFGATPTFRGAVDEGLQRSGRRVFGGGDADVDIGATGTLHASTLIFIANKNLNSFQLGVSAIACPGGESSTLQLANCTKKIIDTAGADRQWVTSDGPQVYIAYHDSANSSLIHIQRSDDDGFSWTRVGSPIPGQGSATGDATFNNIQGPLVADPVFHAVYAVYNAGEAGIQKGTSAAFNNVYVSKSIDSGKTWTATRVAHYPLFTDLNNVFPALAVDPSNGDLVVAWSDGRQVSFSRSTDQGGTWSPFVGVNIVPAATAIFPWISSRNGKTDVVYYATTAASKDDASAVWNVYLAQTANGGASFAQSLVSAHANHVGAVCTEGTACAAGTRNLLDLFEVAINSGGKAAVIYTDDTISKTSSGSALPQIVLAIEK